MEIQKFKNGNKELKIIQDEDPESPREWDNLGIMFCFHKKHGRSFNGERFTKICLICGKKTVKSIWEL